MDWTLDVYLLGEFVGHLKQGNHGALGFQYVDAWLKSERAIPLSQSLPLQGKPFDQPVCHAFFGGILPEEAKRDRIAKNLGISNKNDFAMLAEIGGECAGAITLMPEGQSLNDKPSGYRSLSEADLATILKDLPKRPLMAGEEGIRLSLAGAQDKITVHRSDAGFAIPLNGAPSTHILKPAIEQYEDTVLNEYLCMTLAKSVGLPTAEVAMISVEGIPILCVTRYDRIYTADGTITRTHQEDFCQALGIASEMKYQNEGGVSLEMAFDLIRQVSTLPVKDLQFLLDAVIFNFLIGNHDAHGKNFSLLYQEGEVRLAPFYDILSTAYYPELSQKMAMKIGTKYKLDDVYARNVEQFATEVGLSKPMVHKRVLTLADKIIETLITMEDETTGKLISFIRGRVTSIQKRLAL